MTTEIKSKDKAKGPDDQLAFSRMKDEIEAQASKKADKKIDEAKEKAKEIIKEAKDEASKVKQDILQEAKNEADKKKIQEVSRKKLSSKMDYLEAREAILDEIMVEARSELQKFTKTDEYASFLRNLLESSGVSIGGGNLELHLRKEDKTHFTTDSLNQIASEIENRTGEKTQISVASSDLKTLGGLKLVREDGKLFVDNTFEKRLERSTEETREGLLELLS